MSLTLRQLAYFRALAEQRHFGRAAATVNISQPALSVQIREMEAHLGQPLVERGARDVVLTPFGRSILTHVDRVMGEMRALEDTARWQGAGAGRLRLGMIPTIAPYILPGTLEALRSHDISLDVQVQEGKTDQLVADLSAGQLDAVVMALPVEAEGLVANPLFQDRFLLAGSAARLSLLDSAPEALRPDGLGHGELGRSPLLLLEDGHCLTDQVLDLCGRGKRHAQIDMAASSLATLTQLVAAGFGLTLMPELAVRAEQRAAPDMHLRRFAVPEPMRTIVLVRRAATDGTGWFAALAEVLAQVGNNVVQLARAA
ncbi:hydrogen peroxide-inducible genes activator [Rhodobacteraceae bacterium KMM 6894]|nr:hydrogen peroxide-inducible genes activator [Rhodobacteraceae bacterium KMM 6894]